MPFEITVKLCHFEALVSEGKIGGFSVSLQPTGLLICSKDGVEEQYAKVDVDTLASLKIFFHGVNAIQHDSFDYTSLKSLINAKSIIERMLHQDNNEGS